jgi:hypothetical protein
MYLILLLLTIATLSTIRECKKTKYNTLLFHRTKTKIKSREAYAAGWRDGFKQALQKQTWKPREWREQAKKDSIIYFKSCID